MQEENTLVMNMGTNAEKKSAWRYFVECISKKYCCFKGRANRKEFWGFVFYCFLFTLIVSAALNLLLKDDTIIGYAENVWSFALLLPYLGVIVRRLHDVGFSGKWFLGFLLLVFMVAIYSGAFAVMKNMGSEVSSNANFVKTMSLGILGIVMLGLFIFLLVCMFLPGQKKVNKYGAISESGEKHWFWYMLAYILFVCGFVFSVGFISGYSKATFRIRLNGIIDQTAFLVDGARTLYSGKTSYAGISMEKLAAAGGISEQLVQNSEGNFALINPYGGLTEIMVGNKAENGDDKAILVKFTEVPAASCMALSKFSWGNLQTGFIALLADDGTPMYDKYIDFATINSCQSVAQSGYMLVCGDDADFRAKIDENAACQGDKNTIILKFF